MWNILQNYNKTALILAIIMHTGFLLWSYFSVRNGGSESFQFQLPLPVKIITGSFVIGDLLVFSLLAVVISIPLLFVNDIRYTLFSILTFFAVRSAGEVMYWFNYQFSPEATHKFVNNFSFLGKLSNYDTFVLFQIVNQSVLVTVLILLFALIKNWEVIGRVVR
jgi:hypothetical protein